MTVHTTSTLKPRMKHPVFLIPDAMQALQALGAASRKAGLPGTLHELVNLRASQINGCSVCVDLHCRELRKAGEADERIFAVAAWRDNPCFTDQERAALALTEALTRLADTPEPVPDAIFDEAARHFDETRLAALILAIAGINVWKRLNGAVRQVVGDWRG